MVASILDAVDDSLTPSSSAQPAKTQIVNKPNPDGKATATMVKLFTGLLLSLLAGVNSQVRDSLDATVGLLTKVVPVQLHRTSGPLQETSKAMMFLLPKMVWSLWKQNLSPL